MIKKPKYVSKYVFRERGLTFPQKLSPKKVTTKIFLPLHLLQSLNNSQNLSPLHLLQSLKKTKILSIIFFFTSQFISNSHSMSDQKAQSVVYDFTGLTNMEPSISSAMINAKKSISDVA